MKVIKQSFVIVLAISSVFVIVYTELSGYITAILAFLILISVIYIVIKKRNKKDQELFKGSYTEFYAITVGILLTVFLTNGFHSNLFFLVYFLLFGISFMFEPLTVFIFLIGLLCLFTAQALEGNIVANIIRLGSLVLLSPVAFFFGKEFRSREKLQESIEKESSKILANAQALTDDKKDSILDTRDAAQAIIDSTEKLKRASEKT